MARDKKFIQKELERMADKILNNVPGQVSSLAVRIFLLSDREMKNLKKKFLPQKKSPADVLSFGEPKNWPQPQTREKILGEIYLNRDLTKGNLKKLKALLVHGLSHLLENGLKRKKMIRLK